MTICRRSSLNSFGGMALSLPPKNMFKKQRLDDVIAVVPERDLGDAVLSRQTDTGRRAAGASTSPHMVLPSGMTRFTTA